MNRLRWPLAVAGAACGMTIGAAVGLLRLAFRMIDLIPDDPRWCPADIDDLLSPDVTMVNVDGARLYGPAAQPIADTFPRCLR